MNLNALKAQRKGLRTAFSNCLKKIESELAQELCNFETLSVLKIQLNDKFARMDSCQNAISETLLLSDDGEHLFAEDLEDAEIYREKFWELTTKIELKSSTERKIWTRRLISTNLRSRPVNFGYENAATGRAKADLPLLYDELESKLRSLESLGKTQDKYGDFLTPLVESCLPEEVLVAWERSRNHQTESEGSRSLEQLMNFLRQEVKGEEMVLLARTGLTPTRIHEKGLSCNTVLKLFLKKMICGYIPKIEDKQVLNELKRKKIKFTDSFRRETEINLLIGADVLGKLLTGNSVELESGLTAVETKLGWTVFGKGSCKG
ncbi:integrase catalytic domain-containing protein [Trichonephila clavipes]|uniref:Integrase catalytic domain-containing protein n=1 Tax=Trichonephila clavipes TaxID=2585209 RepID=A0A8X6V2D2_TRICX|nr:integrase catalytic domain-containing protein [Trichonephila clavipes]